MDAVQSTLLGDLIASRSTSDRRSTHDRYRRALDTVGALVEPVAAARILSGDEFQARYATVGEALSAALLIRLELLPELDLRYGVGWGAVTVLDPAEHTEDGPGWWAARAAIDHTRSLEEKGPTEAVRTTYRKAPDQVGPPEPAINAALLCQDHLVGSLDARSIRIVRRLLAGKAKKTIAEEEGISPSAVSQRVRTDGLDILVLAARDLRQVQ